MAKETETSTETSDETTTDETPDPQPAGAAEQPSPGQPPMVVNGQYIKDLSFEAPGAPGIFGAMQRQQPDITVNVDVNAKPMENNTFEVLLHVKAECKVGQEAAFLAELAYGGLFTINVPQEHIEPMLLIECPRMLFPFARNILADATRDGGFPPLMLGMVDFVAMYQNQLKERQAAAESSAEA